MYVSHFHLLIINSEYISYYNDRNMIVLTLIHIENLIIYKELSNSKYDI